MIFPADSVDTANDNWEGMLNDAMVRRSMVLKVPYGYRKLTSEEAASGQTGPVGLLISKLSEATPIIQGIRQRVLSGDSLSAIAAWLNDSGSRLGPYVTSG